MSFLTNPKVIIALIVALLLIIITLTSLNSRVSTPPLTPQPSVPTSNLSPQTTIVPGKTTAEELTKRPGFKKVTDLPNGDKQYEFNSPLLNRANIVITQNGVAILERAVTLDNGKHPRLEEYKADHGEPQRVIEGSGYYGKFETFYIYAEKGFTLVANPFTGEIDEIYTYQPTTVDKFLTNWGEDIKENTEETHP